MNLFNQIENIDAAALNDQSVVKTGGGGRGLLPEGTALVRLSSYIEFGKHIQTFAGQAKPAAPTFKLGFHIVGGGGLNLEGKGEKYVQEEGNFPFISTFETTLSQHEKAKATKYFKALNRVGKQATHFVHKVAEQCLYKLDIEVYKDKNGKDRNAYKFENLQPALNTETFEPMTGLPELTEKHIQVFLWEHCTKEMWDSIKIEGEWDAQKDAQGNITKPAKSKNFLQERCLEAIDFEGSRLQQLLQEIGTGYTIPPLSTTPEEASTVPVPPTEEPEQPSGTVPVIPETPEL